MIELCRYAPPFGPTRAETAQGTAFTRLAAEHLY